MQATIETIREHLAPPEIEIKGKTDEEIIEEIKKLPFIPIIPKETDIYFIVSTKRGNGECHQRCEHCVFNAIPEYVIDWKIAAKIVEDLQKEEYHIGLTPGDTFSESFLSLAKKNTAGSANRIKDLGLMAWSSGTRIAKERNWQDLLEIVYGLGFRSIQINGQNVAGTPLPLKGVPSSLIVNTAIKRIKKWNTENQTKKFNIGLTFTIGKYNSKKEFLEEMLNFCLENQLSIRYNCFADFTGQFPNYELGEMEIRQFYQSIAEITAKVKSESSLKITISPDFGDNGQEFLIPETEKGTCGAGKKLFRIAKLGDEIVIVACAERAAPIVGKVIKNKEKWIIEWDEEKLKQIHYLKPFLYGCFGGAGYKRFNDPKAEKIIFR